MSLLSIALSGSALVLNKVQLLTHQLNVEILKVASLVNSTVACASKFCYNLAFRAESIVKLPTKNSSQLLVILIK